MIKKIKEYLYLEEFGWFELCFILLPILAGYQFVSQPTHLLWILFLSCFALKKRPFHIERRFNDYKKLCLYFFIHNFLWLFVMSHVTSQAVNTYIGQMIILSSVFIIAPVLDLRKFRGTLNIITIICIIGIIYHVMLLMSGEPALQIHLPLSIDTSTEYLLSENMNIFRPKSFFKEPQAYASFMLVPLFLNLYGKRFLFAGIIIISMLLSTSTTAIYTSAIMLGCYMLTQKMDFKWKIVLAVVAAVIAYMLLNLEIFEATIMKATVETNGEERTNVGFIISEQLDFADFIFGIPYATVGEMVKAGKLDASNLMLIGSDKYPVVFVPTFWNIIFIYGVPCLLLYLKVYWDMFKKSKTLWPFLVPIVVTMFSNPDSWGTIYVYNLIFMFGFIKHEELSNKQIR